MCLTHICLTFHKYGRKLCPNLMIVGFSHFDIFGVDTFCQISTKKIVLILHSTVTSIGLAFH